MARAKGSISSAERAERAERVARERARDIWRMVGFHRLICERRGILTLAQIRAMSRLLADHADAIYRRADRAERGAVAPRLTREHSLAALSTRVRRVGQEDDPVTRSTCARLAELGTAKPPATVREIRALAIELVRLSEVVANARHLPFWKSPYRPRGGRHPNVALERLLYWATKHGVSDADLARELDRQGAIPNGPGSEVPLMQRWMAIIKSARARRRKRGAAKSSR
ncbi:MAG TPA: hypothetical protein VFK02_29720 [Kofleriaceae bacterium]|nr:hypothetical protein [Kofleriaceae bacterium]